MGEWVRHPQAPVGLPSAGSTEERCEQKWKWKPCSVTLASIQFPPGLGLCRCQKGGWGEVPHGNPTEGEALPTPHAGSSAWEPPRPAMGPLTPRLGHAAQTPS